MKKRIKNNKLYIILLILLIFIIIYKEYILGNGINHALVYCNLFMIVLMGLVQLIYGLPKDNNYLKSSSIKIIIIILMIYFIFIYLMGFFTGFGRSKFDGSIINMFHNLSSIAFLFPAMEILRYIIFKKNASKLQMIILTLEYIVLDIIVLTNNISLLPLNRLFITVSTIILPIIARECLMSYITYNIGYVPSIIYREVVELYIYIVPFLPALGNYFISVFELVLPFAVYLELKKNIRYREKYYRNAKKALKVTLFTIFTVFFVTLVSLTSGFFKYELIAIVSDSMEPVYNRGDAVIITKKDASEIEIGDILAFNTSFGIVTHRVTKINIKDGQYTFITKGDSNNVEDLYEIHNESVIGTVDYILKYAGYPTVWVKGIFERS